MTDKEYTGTCYIGGVGNGIVDTETLKSYMNLQIRPGDSTLTIHSHTKGYESRQEHINNFIASKHDFIFLTDMDQSFQPDALERLRSHKLPYVSGIYMRRQVNPSPMSTVWFAPFDGTWPVRPWIGIPERGKLHEIGASGWGCVLIHRDVVEAVRGLLKGEWDILEDDMDIYPYDLVKIFSAIGGLEQLVLSPPKKVNLLPALAAHVATLKEEIRPLKVDKNRVGSDIRFPFFAKLAGYQLMGDPDVRCGHFLNYELKLDDLEESSPEYIESTRAQTSAWCDENAKQVRAAQNLANRALRGEL